MSEDIEKKKKDAVLQLKVIAAVMCLVVVLALGLESYFETNPTVEELYFNEARRATTMWAIALPVLFALIGIFFALLMKVRKIERDLTLNTVVSAIGERVLPVVPPAQDNASRLCPWCAESIKKAAIVCRYCGRSVEPT
jgi:hypothetical protein